MLKRVATKIAHSRTLSSLSPAANVSLRSLQDLITAEKLVLSSLDKLSVDVSKAAEALHLWGVCEGDDLSDILSASTAILLHFSAALSGYAAREHTIRDHLKAIRTRYEALEELKRRRKSALARADGVERTIKKAEIKQKSQDLAGERDLLDQLRVQIRRMDGEIRADEAALGDFKRSRTRALMGLKFGGLMECCEKGCAVADIGRVVVAEISEERTHPCRVRSMYTSHQRTAQRVVEAEHRVDAVGFAPLPPEGTQTPLAPPRQTHSWSVGATSMHSTAQRVVEAEHRVDAVGFAPLPPEGTQTPLAPPRQTHSWSVGAASMHSTRSSLNDTLGEEIGSDAADARRSMADSTSEMLDSAYAREIADQERFSVLDAELARQLQAGDNRGLDKAHSWSVGAASMHSMRSSLNDTGQSTVRELTALGEEIGSDAADARCSMADSTLEMPLDSVYAQKIADQERLSVLDAELARQLQAGDNRGLDKGQVVEAERLRWRIIDATHIEDTFLEFSGLMDHEWNRSMKGKQPGRALIKTIENKEKDECIEGDRVYNTSNALSATCGICMETFRPTYSPYTASRTANSSSHLQFGLLLPCPQQHGYCIGCLTAYIDSKIDPDNNGGNSSNNPFPIRCPECQATEFVDGISDAVAARILSLEKMVLWDHQRLLHSVQHFFCPNPKCSAMIEIPETIYDLEEACPSCHQLMCAACHVLWHQDISCEQYQSLPTEERSPEDRALIQLAKTKNWQRCPMCSAVVELVSGCNHMTCRCGCHFCFKCGSLSTTSGLCQGNPSCGRG